ncbi:hypothetical protein [Companilactobacillus mishanensis]|uniref:Uncharacterized protein n=1 Tax=Companilactobacillus mishanensis TaxID=2486008 RepID=A0ABW9P3V0_9LACO|nr:hypothetical protein [Companilactobacillus mishanensis]MQS43945.1 hypothetical protein [Companilactobacillus mishanensis]
MNDEEFTLESSIYGRASMKIVLQNGNEFMELIKKAQQDSAELQKDLERLQHMNPIFKTK